MFIQIYLPPSLYALDAPTRFTIVMPACLKNITLNRGQTFSENIFQMYKKKLSMFTSVINIISKISVISMINIINVVNIVSITNIISIINMINMINMICMTNIY